MVLEQSKKQAKWEAWDGVREPMTWTLKVSGAAELREILTRLEERHAGLDLSSQCFRLDPGSTYIREAGEQGAELKSVHQVHVMVGKSCC